jgi:hypothetical protein
MHQAMVAMRYDEEWLEASDPEISCTDRWYMLMLASGCSIAPSLSDPLQTGHYVLRTMLPSAGWTPDEVNLLIHGHELATLIATAQEPLFTSAFSPSQHGGWLDNDAIARLQTRLTHSGGFFSAPESAGHPWLQEYGKLVGNDPAKLLDESFHSSLNMLTIARTRGSALYLVLD